MAMKRLTVVQCWLTQGKEPDEKSQPILWTERPTGGALVGAGSLWPSQDLMNSRDPELFKTSISGPRHCRARECSDEGFRTALRSSSLLFPVAASEL
jgi:hypothetical protein